MTRNELLLSSLKPGLTKKDYGHIAGELVAAGYLFGHRPDKYAIARDISFALSAGGAETTTLDKVVRAAEALEKALKDYLD
jgi:hypothetical protein